MLSKSIGKAILILCAWIIWQSLTHTLHAACEDNDGDGYGWDNDTRTSCDINSASTSNTSNAVGARISWNGVTGADRYRAQWNTNGGNWTTTQTIWNVTFDLYFTEMGVQLGSVFCVRVAAADYTEDWTDYGPDGCITIPASGSTGLSSPSGLQIQLIQ